MLFYFDLLISFWIFHLPNIIHIRYTHNDVKLTQVIQSVGLIITQVKLFNFNSLFVHLWTSISMICYLYRLDFDLGQLIDKILCIILLACKIRKPLNIKVIQAEELASFIWTSLKILNSLMAFQYFEIFDQ